LMLVHSVSSRGVIACPRQTLRRCLGSQFLTTRLRSEAVYESHEIGHNIRFQVAVWLATIASSCMGFDLLCIQANKGRTNFADAIRTPERQLLG
jgi:hypothetical protein